MNFSDTLLSYIIIMFLSISFISFICFYCRFSLLALWIRFLRYFYFLYIFGFFLFLSFLYCWQFIFCFCLCYVFRHSPQKYSAFCSNWNYGSLIWTYCYPLNCSRMSSSRKNAHTLIILPHFNFFIFTSWNEMFAFFCNGKCINLTFITAIEHPYSLSIKDFPICYFAIRSRSK